MFMQRLITSLILAPLVLLAIFYGHPWLLAGLMLIILVASGAEFLQLIPLTNRSAQAVFLLLLLGCTWVCGLFFSYWLYVGLILWILIFFAELSFPKSQQFWGYKIIVAITGLLLIPLFLQSLVQLYNHSQGKGLIVFVLFIVWAADVGAYLAGKRFGVHKLIPQVSPGKSWEGALGGFLLAILVAIVGTFIFYPMSLINWFALTIITVIVSIVGDLFISILKRRCHLKDTGSIIPGHGGILDRLDSLIAALPWFYFGLTNLPIGV